MLNTLIQMLTYLSRNSIKSDIDGHIVPYSNFADQWLESKFL